MALNGDTLYMSFNYFKIFLHLCAHIHTPVFLSAPCLKGLCNLILHCKTMENCKPNRFMLINILYPQADCSGKVCDAVMRQLFLSSGVSPPGICFGCGAILRASLVQRTWQILGSSNHPPLQIPYVPHSSCSRFSDGNLGAFRIFAYPLVIFDTTIENGHFELVYLFDMVIF